jgi:hypothetical protein
VAVIETTGRSRLNPSPRAAVPYKWHRRIPPEVTLRDTVYLATAGADAGRVQHTVAAARDNQAVRVRIDPEMWNLWNLERVPVGGGLVSHDQSVIC